MAAPPITSRHLLLDANVLLLFLVGLWKASRVATFKNTNAFTLDDFERLKEIVSQFDQLLTTPHILAEVSNLAGQHGEPEKTELFRDLATRIRVMEEHHVPASAALSDPIFERLGLTDAAICVLSSGQPLQVLTTDVTLWVHLLSAGVTAHNFNHLRSDELLS